MSRRKVMKFLLSTPLAVAAIGLAMAAPPAFAQIHDSIGCGAPAGAEQVTTTATTSIRTQELSTGTCYAYTSAMSGPGYASAMASAALNAPPWLYNSMYAETNASFSERMSAQMLWDGVPPDDFGAITGRASVSVSGTVSASGTGAHSHAYMNYGVSIQGISAGGQQSASNLNPFYQDGQWGTVVLGPLLMSPNDVLTLTGTSRVLAGVLKGYGDEAHTSALADFSHTLLWGGLSDLQALDIHGNPMAMPDNLRFSLIGLDSGFNYVNAAVNPFAAPTAPIPEPSTYALMLVGLALVTGVARRRRAAAR